MKFSHNDFIYLLVFLGSVLIISRVITEFFKKFNLPVIMSEISLGIILGPTILGTLFPNAFTQIYSTHGSLKIAFDSIISLSVVMFLFIAGIEVKLNSLFNQGKKVLFTSIGSILFPFIMGFSTAWFLPNIFLYNPNQQFIYSMFLGTAMAISALPVIIRILMDLNIFNTEVGVIVITSAIISDIVGWVIFSVILGMLGKSSEIGNIYFTLTALVLFLTISLTIGRKIIDNLLIYIHKNFSWPGGVLSFSLGLCFLGAAFTEYIGLHAILGAFIVGIVFGDSENLDEPAQEIIHQFINNIFTPLFFVSLGLKVNFIKNFDPLIVFIILSIAIICKLLGSTLGGVLGGLKPKTALAVGFGLNARGAMEIVLGTLALDAGLINEKIFVALVVMAIVTSVMSAPMMKKFI
ncbi:MAG: cation:proton antiporter [Candidatus Sericytochromatia bacterium]